MTRDDAIAALKALEPEARALGATGLYLFGSTARGEAGPDSDVDVFIEADLDHGFSALELIGIGHLIKDRTGLEADIGTRSGLHPHFRRAIEAEAVRVF
jgi:hypothetical protein